MLKIGLGECWNWLVINLILPILIPYIFAVLCLLIINDKSVDFFRIIKLLDEKGIYMFLGLSLLISVFQDYHDAKSIFKPRVYLILGLCILFTGFIFISNLQLIENGKMFSDNLTEHHLILLISIIIAIYIKIKILRIKLKNKYYGS